MILINLLPHREERRRQRKRAFFISLAACVAAGVVAVGLWYSVLQQMTSVQESRNAFLKTEIARLDAQIKDIATLRTEIDALKARQKAVEDLQTDRNIPVHLLNELVQADTRGRLSDFDQAERPGRARQRRGTDQRAGLRIPAQHAVQLALAGAA